MGIGLLGDAADDSVVLPEARVFDLCDNLPEVLDRLLVTFLDDDVSNAHLFDPLRERFDNNALRASGIPPEKRHEATGKHPTFRRWRHMLESIIAELKRDYELPGEMRSASRNFAGYGGGDFGPPPAFASYQQEMDDTAIEIEHIIASFEKRGEPKRRTKSESPAELESPEKVTIAWLLKYVPVSIWAGAAAVVITSFALGFAAAKTDFFRKLAELLSGP